MCREFVILNLTAVESKYNYLRILTGKKHRQIKLQCLEKVRIRAFGFLVH